jgi:F420-non-reducing hydrogenase small subunit
MSKPRIGFYWCSSCGGCEESVVDLAEDVLAVVAAVDIVFWPVAMDFKREDVEAMPDGSLTACFMNGAIRSDEQEEMAHLLRRKSQVLIAFGSCAHLGGIPALANLYDRDAILKRVYDAVPSTQNPSGTRPQVRTPVDGTGRALGSGGNGRVLSLPTFDASVRTLDQTVEVDYYIPGCPPPVKLLKQAVEALLSGNLPARGSVLAPDIALCQECSRKDTKPDKLLVTEFKRPHEVLADPEKCLLVQGLLCLGPATRSGCDAPCIEGNMPCTGCMGPTSRVRDFGAKALTATASVLDAGEEEQIATLLDAIVDPEGTFYRYSLAGSLLGGKLGTQEGSKA